VKIASVSGLLKNDLSVVIGLVRDRRVISRSLLYIGIIISVLAYEN
jgi:hypothetical protein